MTKDIETYVKYLIQKSKDTLNEVHYVLKGEFYNLGMSRLYYSAFYCVQALLMCIDQSPKTHKGMLITFNKNFIATDKIQKNVYNFYADLFKARQEADYNDFIQYKEEEVIINLEKTEKFINEISDFINKNYLT